MPFKQDYPLQHAINVCVSMLLPDPFVISNLMLTIYSNHLFDCRLALSESILQHDIFLGDLSFRIPPIAASLLPISAFTDHPSCSAT